MTLKEAAANSLLAFVASTCVVLIVRALERPKPLLFGLAGGASQSSSQVVPTRASADRAVVNGVRVYYLHGNIRCPTCRSIEAYTQEAIEAGFPAELQSRKLDFQVVNYDQPGNQHYQRDYEVVAPTVVITKWRDGKEVDWRNLNQVWEYVHDKSAFLAFVQNHVREFLGQPALPQTAGSQLHVSPPADRVLPVPDPLP